MSEESQWVRRHLSEPILKLPLVTKRLGRSGATRSIIDANNVMLGTYDASTAREIVRRCNTYDALLAACRKAKYVFGIPSISANRDEQGALQGLSAALDLAEKGQP